MLSFHNRPAVAALLGLAMTMTPYGAVWRGGSPAIASLTAAAKNGAKGSSNGHGHGATGGKGNAGAGESGKGKPDKEKDREASVVSPTGDRVEISGSTILVRHANGMKESIKDGFYEMTDAKGRRIIKRRAMQPDRARLLGMAR